MTIVVFGVTVLLAVSAPGSGPSTVQFQAHRGGLKEVPENTLAAYRYAWDLGAIPEVDICATSDGVIVCLHDTTLKRTTNAETGQNTPVSKLTFEEIRQWDAGSWFDEAFVGEKVPSLEEVFQEMAARKDARIYLDLKNVDLEQLGQLIRQYDVARRVIFCHNTVESCRKMRAAVPGVLTMLWIGGAVDEIQEKFLKVADEDFEGLDQVQLHLQGAPKTEGGVEYLMSEEFLELALEMTREKNVDLEVLPFVFDCDSLSRLLDLGIRWYATDEPKRFKACVANYEASMVVTTEQFAREVERVLPEEERYDYHKRLSQEPVHVARRNSEAGPSADEFELPDHGWKLIWNQQSGVVLQTAVQDFQDYLKTSMAVNVEVEARDSLADWESSTRCIIVGTRDQLPGCGETLKEAKDYEIAATPERVMVCGFDERGAMFGLYNLEARMNLREAPILPIGLNTVRHSLYDARIIHSWMGWMKWPDALLSHLAHDGFDGIFASCYANPNGERTTAETSTDFYARLLFRIRQQDPAVMHDLIERASRHGIKVYAPIIYQYLGTPESEEGLRALVRDILEEFPDIQGYILLTEGFWYKKWGGLHGAPEEHVKDWAQNWCRAVGVVAEECHRVNPDTEILPWEYNIDFRPQNAEIKRYFIQQLPAESIPLLTWENGKSFEIDGMQGYLRDYSLNQIGPAEVTEAQIAEARQRNMKVYSKADTFAAWQFGTIPYLPFPYQWYERYKALEKYGVNGTLESWSSGYTPNLMTELRAWTCWTGAPPFEELLGAVAARKFGAEQKEMVLEAWNHFSQAIRVTPDTGPNMGTNNAVGNPLFFQEPPLRTGTFTHSWKDHNKWMGYFGSLLNPYWPFTVSRMVFYPDFTNRTNKAEQYARRATGVVVEPETNVLPVFLKYLRRASDHMEEGLKLYRAAALASPEAKRQVAVREVVVAEQIQRMMQSNCAVLEFEDLRLQLVAEEDPEKAAAILGTMEAILREEIDRTERSLLAATRDSRLGFQSEQDYVYTPYSLREKLESLHETLEQHLPDYRKHMEKGQP